jgi:ATP-dependent DNA helicase RecQ
VFGILGGVDEPAVRSWIDQLIVQDFLAVDLDSDYPVLRMTAAGRELCRGSGEVRLGEAVRVPTGRRRRGQPTANGRPEDGGRFERLRLLRAAVARRLGLPPYVIFHDSVLRDVAAANPASLTELATIRGMGEKKLERYGGAVLRVLAGQDPSDVAAAF